MHTINLKPLICVLALALAGAAFAQYNPDNDVYITVDNPVVEEVAEDIGLGELGDDLFEAQEGVHETVKETTGEEVDHYYIHICSGKQCVPVDPFRFGR